MVNTANEDVQDMCIGREEALFMQVTGVIQTLSFNRFGCNMLNY